MNHKHLLVDVVDDAVEFLKAHVSGHDDDGVLAGVVSQHTAEVGAHG